MSLISENGLPAEISSMLMMLDPPPSRIFISARNWRCQAVSSSATSGFTKIRSPVLKPSTIGDKHPSNSTRSRLATRVCVGQQKPSACRLDEAIIREYRKIAG